MTERMSVNNAEILAKFNYPPPNSSAYNDHKNLISFLIDSIATAIAIDCMTLLGIPILLNALKIRFSLLLEIA